MEKEICRLKYRSRNTDLSNTNPSNTNPALPSQKIICTEGSAFFIITIIGENTGPVRLCQNRQQRWNKVQEEMNMTERELQALLDDMTLPEKIDQMLQVIGAFFTVDDTAILTGPAQAAGITPEDIALAGSGLNASGAERMITAQKQYMEAHPHHIPLLFMGDIIHGFRTIFPMPLAQGAMFDPELSGKCAAVAAKEAAVSGLHVTFAPMCDLVRDARWGRVMESTGEDPYLNGKYAAAMVKGFQGEDMKDPGKVCACVKHFAAYGAAEAGRDYNTAELSEHTLRDFYLKAYREGIDAGAGMVMTSFNTVNGVPASVNRWLMRDVLRDEMGFDGVLISDYSAIRETIAHGCSADERDAAAKALEAGVDIDMMTGVYSGNLKALVEDGTVDEALVDESVMRILRLKNRLGLFENPYKDADPEEEKKVILCREHRSLAREAAQKSFVLLENNGILPLDRKKKIAFIGPYVESRELNSSWAVTGKTEDCVTVREAAEEYADLKDSIFCADISDPEQVRKAAQEADTVVLALGESFRQSGEAASRAMLDLPEEQMDALREAAAVNENIVVVLFSGRPLDLREVKRRAKAVLEVWLPGTEGGHAILDVLTGQTGPSGKLPMSFPYCVGQVPVYYNHYSTGRPQQPGSDEKYVSRYLDIPNEPLYPFGYGLTYTTFEISPVALDKEVLKSGEKLTAGVRVTNTGDAEGTETVQLYIQDVAASVVRPVRELRGIRKVSLKPGQSEDVSFEIGEEMLAFLRQDGTVGTESGTFRVWIGDSSATENQAEFTGEFTDGNL